MIKRETVVSLLAGFLVGACGIVPVVAGDGFSFGPAQGAASGGGGGSGDIEGVTAGNGLTGGGTSGSVTLNVAVSAGLTANADEITLDEELQDVAGTSPTDNGVLIGNGSAFVVESGATLKTSLGLTIGTDVQAYDEELADVAGVTPTDNSVVAGNGSELAMETLTSLLDSAFGSTRGQILFRGSTAWQVLAVGTAGQVLESGGAGADVSWGTDGGGGWDGTTSVAMTGSVSLTGDGDQMSEGIRRRVYTYTGGSGAATTLSRGQSGAIVCNTGATEETYVNLPTLDGAEDVGLVYTFDCTAASAGSYGIRFVAASGDTITVGTDTSASAGYVRTTIVGSVVTVYANSTSNWRAVSGSLGPWEVN